MQPKVSPSLQPPSTRPRAGTYLPPPSLLDPAASVHVRRVASRLQPTATTLPHHWWHLLSLLATHRAGEHLTPELTASALSVRLLLAAGQQALMSAAVERGEVTSEQQ